MEHAIVTVPASPVRRKARHQSEMINQLLFGETVEILKRKKRNWTKVRSIHDEYEGWLTENMLQVLDEGEVITSDHVVTDTLGWITMSGQRMQVPFGSSLPGFSDGKGIINKVAYEFEGNYSNRMENAGDMGKLLQYARSWLNVPYMWGGRTPLGADCSGFVQVIYKVSGIDLPRDTWQQAQEGEPVKRMKDAQAGDLVFFDDKDEIVHVAIVLNAEQLIHEYGKVRIDTIDKKGIINSDTGKRTHQLEAIRRINP